MIKTGKKIRYKTFIPGACCIKGCDVEWPRDRETCVRHSSLNPASKGWICTPDLWAFYQKYTPDSRVATNLSVEVVAMFDQVSNLMLSEQTHYQRSEKYVRETVLDDKTILRRARVRETHNLARIAKDQNRIHCPTECGRTVIAGRVAAITPVGSSIPELVCGNCARRIVLYLVPRLPSRIAHDRAKRRELWKNTPDTSAYRGAEEDVPHEAAAATCVQSALLEHQWFRDAVTGQYFTMTGGAHQKVRGDVEHTLDRIRGFYCSR
jgi:hypothetical protein